MKYKQCFVQLPKSLNKITKLFNEAKELCFQLIIDEKSTINNPSFNKRNLSDKSFIDAWNIIINNKPHITCYFRDVSYFNKLNKDYWEFSLNNIYNEGEGYFFIWIKVDVTIGNKLIEKYKLKIINLVDA